HHGRFTAKPRGDTLPHFVVKLVEHHVVSGGVRDGRQHFRRHERRRHGGVGPGRVDEGTHAQLPEVVPCALGGRGGGPCARADEAPHQGPSRNGLQKTSSAPHLLTSAIHEDHITAHARRAPPERRADQRAHGGGFLAAQSVAITSISTSEFP